MPEIIFGRIPRELRAVTKDAVEFFLAEYMQKRSVDRLEYIKVGFNKCDSPPGDDIAHCDPQFIDSRWPNAFHIDFNPMYSDIQIREYLATLFHELQHAKQFATRQLSTRRAKDGSTYETWKGRPIAVKKDSYWKRPWEIDAFGVGITALAAFRDARPQYRLKDWAPSYDGRATSGWNEIVAGLEANKPDAVPPTSDASKETD